MARKRRRRHPQSVYLACAAILGAALLYWIPTSQRLARDLPDPGMASAANRGDPAPVRRAAIRTLSRPVYPHSVIRGGAYSVAELEAALDADPVVAAHYAVFDRTRLRTNRAPLATAVYVSYRQGDRIFWTRRKVPLPAEEPLLTDGIHAARSRCGNRIALTPQEPTQAGEPSATDLDRPEPPPTTNPSASAAAPPDEFPVPMLVHEIFPPLYAVYAHADMPLPGPREVPFSPQFPPSPALPAARLINVETPSLPPASLGFLWPSPIPLPRGYPPGLQFQPITPIPPPPLALVPPSVPIPFTIEIPEPATAALLLCGAAILARRRFSSRRLS